MDEIDRDQAGNDLLLETMIARNRSAIRHAASRATCQVCGADIPEKRQQLIPGVFLCIDCQCRVEHGKPSDTPVRGFTMRIGTGVHF
ncbi:MAG: TraR/DksA family transcriptional regulator [Scandinavium sp.]|uniref:TraR/DksA family transcriptional regulator n=1 Tax=Scandinavium sp. TaxID=2830653 RepID=UPI003F2FB364